MFRRFPHIAAASLAALTIGLSACSNATPTSSPSADQQSASQGSPAANASGSSQSSPGATNPENTAGPRQKAADPDLSSKVLTGEVAGVTLKKMDQLPDMENAVQGTDVQVEPANCLSTGITQLGAGAMAMTQNGVESVLLSSDATAPGKYKEYAQRCASASGTVSGSPFKQSIETQQVPAVDGVNDLVAVANSSESSINGKALNAKAYLLIGSLNGTTIIAQSTTLTGQEPSQETVTELFKAQVEKLKG
ncbi:hypothetical protein [[Pseudopropionibacterium] massiliense]|uniref:hypothetical protein n=1 Tax=[Pseudopropionibacterium] massiliense TaxID=2220000 RepID=UPI001031E651|nr:hypothetical protein [[Pseudopropionibacterium] massiliense]